MKGLLLVSMIAVGCTTPDSPPQHPECFQWRGCCMDSGAPAKAIDSGGCVELHNYDGTSSLYGRLPTPTPVPR